MSTYFREESYVHRRHDHPTRPDWRKYLSEKRLSLPKAEDHADQGTKKIYYVDSKELDLTMADRQRSNRSHIHETTLDELEKSHSNRSIPIDWKEELLAIMFLFIFPGIMVWGFPVFFLSLYVAYENPWSPLSWLMVMVWSFLILYPFKQNWKDCTRNLVTMALFKYFSFKIIWEDELDFRTAPHIIVAPPHGAFPFGNMLAIAFFDIYEDFRLRSLASTALFYSPVCKQICCWLGAIEASRESSLQTLKDKHSVGISSGGIAEVFETVEDEETIVLSRRKGFIRLAMQTGARIVPCYVFGNTLCLKVFSDRSRILSTLSRKLRFPLTCFYGRKYSPVPYRVPLWCVMGKPITVDTIPDGEEPDEDRIDQIHEQFIVQIVDLFDRYKAAYGWSDKKLIIK